MRHWSARSREIHNGLHPILQDVADYILQNIADITLLSGHRTERQQNHLFTMGRSRLQYPKSKHNRFPSEALDFQPYPYPDQEPELWAGLALVAGAAIAYAEQKHGVKLRWGGDWNQNGSVVDNGFDDLFHLELP
jgi:peptidoglycan L-alanyl-D-glutamate endopeptidase CwlK